MKRVLPFILLCLFCLHVHADWQFGSTTRYKLSCGADASRFVGLGSAHGQSYPLCMVTSVGNDCYWYISGNDKSGYVFRNAQTGQYMAWSSNYADHRYLALSSTLNESCYWNLRYDEASETIEVSTIGKYTGERDASYVGTYYFNVRSSGQLGTYKSSDNNGHTRIFDEQGNAITPNTPVTPVNPPVEPPVDHGESTVVAHGGQMLYLTGDGNRLFAIPVDYLDGDYDYTSDHTFNVRLLGGEELAIGNVTAVEAEMPYDYPVFQSYKFNNEFNYQVFTTAEAKVPGASEILLPVGGIGKSLTASFKLDDGVYAWVDGKLQQSKKTRMRFDKPITYTIGRENWRELQLLRYADGTYTHGFVPFGFKTTVTVDWLCDHPTTAYGVPEVRIVTSDRSNITSKDYYKEATIEIDGAGVFPDLPLTDVLVKGRGNSSWSEAKKPYRLKFASKQKPFGLPKSKSWVLLANAISGSMTTNAVEHKMASLMEADAACHIIPVELYVNDRYYGSYNFCEKVGFSNSSVDILDDEYAAMMEIDINNETNNVPPVLRDRTYGMCYKIHEPDLYEPDYTGSLTAADVIADFNRLTAAVRAGTYDKLVDLNSLVSYLTTCEVSMHQELMHSKSVFCYSENVTDGFNIDGLDESPWHFGPIWDCDWSFGHEAGSYYINSAEANFYSLLYKGSNGQFWNDLRYNNPEVDRIYYYRMNEFMTSGALDELLEFCDDYYAFAAKSLSHNSSGYNASDGSNYATVTSNCKQWLKTRADYVYSHLTPYDIPLDTLLGDANGDGVLTIADLSRLSFIALGFLPDLYGNADITGDGKVDAADVRALATTILQK